MPRNITLQLLRGTLAHMPTLSVGELYVTTDTFELYVGTSAGNKRVGVFAPVLPGTGNVSAQAFSSVPGGPTNPRKPVGFVEVNLGGDVGWFPFYQ